MAEPAFLGIDIGTLDIGGVLVSKNGKVLARHRLNLQITSPEPGIAEHNPQRDWWENTCVIIKHLLAESGVNPKDVHGVGIAGLFPVLCALDSDGLPVGQAILYSDSRAEHEVIEVERVCNQTLIGDEVSPNLVWLARHRLADFSRISTVLSSTGYIVYQLTGRKVIDPHNAYRFGGLVDETRLSWNPEIITALGLPAHILPEINRSTDVVGGVSVEASQATGLAPGTPVITGTTDSFAALIGNGALQPGDAVFNYGTSGFLALVTLPLSQAIQQPACWGSEKPYFLAVYLLGSGAILRWAMDLFNGLVPTSDDLDHLYDRLDSAALDIPPGAGGLLVLPYWNGRFYPQPDGSARGHIAGLTLQHKAGHLWRALMEAPGYVLATRLDKPLPHSIRRLITCGGGARSHVWRRIISDMVGLPQYFSSDASGALGIAFLAAFGLGYQDSLESIRDEWLRNGSITEPDPEKHAEYRKILPRWQAFDDQIRISDVG